MEPRTKTILFWTFVACLCFFGIPIHRDGGNDDYLDNHKLELLFRNYSQIYGKKYSEDEIQERLPHFKAALRKIQVLNDQDDDHILRSILPKLMKTNGDNKAEDPKKIKNNHFLLKYIEEHKWKGGMPKNHGFATYGLTIFADLSQEEFEKGYLSKVKKDLNHEGHRDHKHHQHLILNRRRKRSPSKLPAKMDWREKDVITPILHQKGCGACWAFSTVGTVESMRAIQTGEPPQPLSIQYVIDCAKNGNLGCQGGDTCNALQWMGKTKLVPASKYPLTLEDGKCKIAKPSSGVQIYSNFTCNDYTGSEDDLLEVLAYHGPVAAAVDATNWQYYVGGVIQWNCDANHNHAVQIVGYDKTATPPHYIIRNSWGTDFGDGGYLYVAIGSNLCGIARQVSSVTVQVG